MEKKRNDFNLRELQLKLTDVLKAVAECCEKNNLTYYLSDGTLLGAVRHKGFIPWDDDIDISMPYADYKKFLEIAPQELGDNFYVQSSFSDPLFHCAYAKVRVNNTTMMKLNHRPSQAHQGAWIDIFPIIEVNGGLEYKYKKLLIKFSNFMMIDDYILGCEDEYKEMLKCFYPLLRLFLKFPISFRQHWHNTIIDNIGKKSGKKSASYIWANITRLYPKEVLLGQHQQVEFEGRLFSTYPKPLEYLKTAYGNFMQLPPKEERYNHSQGMIVDLDRNYTVYIQDK